MTLPTTRPCESGCTSFSSEFDAELTAETTFSERLHAVCHSNVGWYGDKSISSQAEVPDWGIDERFGVYILWHKESFCDVHETFLMRALYVSRGHVKYRLRQHWKNKSFADQMLVYWSYLEMSNRKSKYIEQLLLDSFKFGYNANENRGQQPLLACFSQNEVD